MCEPVSGKYGVLVSALMAVLLPANPGAQVAPDPALRSEWLVARPGADVLGAAADVLRAMGVRVARHDAARGLLVSRPAAYTAAWPDVGALGLPATQVPRAATLHVYVAPGFVPARLAVGAILTTDTTFTPLRGAAARGDSTMFGHPGLAAAVAARIAARLGVSLVLMPADADQRAAAAAQLGQGGCGPARLLTGTSPGPLPSLVSEVKPEYPRPELARRLGGAVQVMGEVTEHGTVAGLRWVAGVEEPNLVAAALGAASLWRFVAPVVDGCPVRREVTIEMSFRQER